MMLIFTLCSNNYLAHAKTLGDSIIRYNPEARFVIGLVDERNDIVKYSDYNEFTIVEVRDLGIENFDVLVETYNIVEFNTCVKASYFKYLFKQYNNAEAILYFDPDIMVFDTLNVLTKEFNEYEILLTPHIVSPLIPDEKHPNENTFLNYGVFNLGFIGVHRNCTVAGGFLDWWEERLLTKGIMDTCNGYFVDQLWINLVPVFFDQVKVLKELRFNAAPWNLHERKISEDNKIFRMQDGKKLMFYHFSSYNFKSPEQMSKSYDRFSFSTNPDLIPLYQLYHDRLLANQIATLSDLKNSYMIKGDLHRKQAEDSRNSNLNRLTLGKIVDQVIPPFISKALQYIFK